MAARVIARWRRSVRLRSAHLRTVRPGRRCPSLLLLMTPVRSSLSRRPTRRWLLSARLPTRRLLLRWPRVWIVAVGIAMLLLLLLRGRMGLEQGVQGGRLAGWWLLTGMLLLLLLLLRGHVPVGRGPVWGDHRAGFAAGSHPVVGVRVGPAWGHVWVVVIARVLLVLHRRLAVHLVLGMLRMMLHRVLLVMVVHVRSTTAFFAVGSRVLLGWTGIAGRWHVIVRMHSGRWPFRMGRRWSTGCRRRSTAGAIATCRRRRFHSLFPTHYWTTLRILSTGMSIGTILQITRLVCLWLMVLLIRAQMMIACNTLFQLSLLLCHLHQPPRLSSSWRNSR